MKKFILSAALLCAVIFVFIILSRGGEVSQDVVLVSGADPANTTYLIEGEPVTLVGGVAEKSMAGSSSTERTFIFSQPVVGDLDGDQDMDMALLLQRETGGSGAFFYLAVALQNPDKTAQGLNTLFVGDRVAPQNIQIKDGLAILNYADRKPGEPMTAQPSVGVSLYAGVENGVLVKHEPLQ